MAIQNTDELSPIAAGETGLYLYHQWMAELSSHDIVTNSLDLKDPKTTILAGKSKLASSVEDNDETLDAKGPDTIPKATYRLQFNPHWTFDNALDVVHYLKMLGISHCYASPLLQARSGSMHGYDIVSHRQINPELGSEFDFNRFTDRLKEYGLGLILDMVPNHMGIGSDNPWWMDVLENGESSPYSEYFDIDWEPIKPELHGKVLLPVLGDHYGNVLANRQLSLNFEPELGRFQISYYEHFFPVNPRSYPNILGYRLHQLKNNLQGNHYGDFEEYLSIIRAFEKLPNHYKTSDEERQTRLREKTIACQRLTTLCRQNPDIVTFIQGNLPYFGQNQSDVNSQERLHQLLEHQPYRLAYWRVAMDEINYRRFFDVNDLASIRMENPRVFNEAHELIFKLVAQGKVQGLRIDHPDGLFDPASYFQQLQLQGGLMTGKPFAPEDNDDNTENNSSENKHKPLYIAVEKILAPHESLPDDWPVHGTTGYEFLNQVTGLWVDTHNEKALNKIYQRFTGRPTTAEAFEELVHRCKILIMQTSLASELSVLAHHLNRISEKNWSSRDYTQHQLRNALMEVVACFPVYRTYITLENGVSRTDTNYIDWAVSAAQKRSLGIDASIFDFIRQVLMLELQVNGNALTRQELLNFVVRFQQYTSPVMAKSLEDTAFYRFNRLVALNEVGGEPGHFGFSVSAFHHQNQWRQENYPANLLGTSTHDTKRSEDVRAKLTVLSEIPQQWQQLLTRWSRFNRLKKTALTLKIPSSTPQALPQDLAPSKNDEYLIYQTLLGIWPYEPMTEAIRLTLVQRAQDYMIKAVREAKEFSSWLNPNDAYEMALHNFIADILADNTSNIFFHEMAELNTDLSFAAMMNSLSQTVLKLTSPGVPDIYQGTELWDLSLVDPDNRRPVDYAQRKTILDAIDKAGPDNQAKNALLNQYLDSPVKGEIKLFVIYQLLQLRSQYPALFKQGDYQPVTAEGELSEHVVAFTRTLENAESVEENAPDLLVVVPRLSYWLFDKKTTGLRFGAKAWAETTITLPDSFENKNGFERKTLTNLLSGQQLIVENPSLPLDQLLLECPVGVFKIN